MVRPWFSILDGGQHRTETGAGTETETKKKTATGSLVPLVLLDSPRNTAQASAQTHAVAGLCGRGGNSLPVNHPAIQDPAQISGSCQLWNRTRAHRLLMLVEEPLPGSPSRPVPAAIGVTDLVLHPQHQSARPWFVYRGMIDRQSGQGEETGQRREPRYSALCIAHRTLRTMRLRRVRPSSTGQLPFWKSGPPETTCHVPEPS